MAALTDEQIAQEEAFLKGLPRLNLGALFMPPIWGPAHGMWATVLFYPLWLFADNAIYAAWSERTPLAFVVAALVFASLTAGTVAFAILGQPFAAHRAASKGMARLDYLKRERLWAVVSLVLAVAMLAWASYYNLALRPGLEGA
ncbi:MAG: hypothetical protein LBG81_06460 [Coriobacteriaceae bacterium]|jgi:hypothetical protein|nr:hypothetical protein [Coriobacteriaceae bacterium]